MRGKEKSKSAQHKLIFSGSHSSPQNWTEGSQISGICLWQGDMSLCGDSQIKVDMWMQAQAWAQMLTLKHGDSDRLHITKSFTNRPQYFMNILPLSVRSSIFYYILACSAFLLWKKFYFCQRCSSVRVVQRGKWKEREGKSDMRGENMLWEVGRNNRRWAGGWSSSSCLWL